MKEDGASPRGPVGGASKKTLPDTPSSCGGGVAGGCHCTPAIHADGGAPKVVEEEAGVRRGSRRVGRRLHLPGGGSCGREPALHLLLQCRGGRQLGRPAQPSAPKRTPPAPICRQLSSPPPNHARPPSHRRELPPGRSEDSPRRVAVLAAPAPAAAVAAPWTAVAEPAEPYACTGGQEDDMAQGPASS